MTTKALTLTQTQMPKTLVVTATTCRSTVDLKTPKGNIEINHIKSSGVKYLSKNSLKCYLSKVQIPPKTTFYIFDYLYFYFTTFLKKICTFYSIHFPGHPKVLDK
jgi:hypothetical protein